MKIGELLVSQGIITEVDVEKALKAQKRRGGKLGTNLVALNCISDRDLAQGLATQFDLPCAQWKDFEHIDSDVTELVLPEFVEMHSIVPLKKAQELIVAVGAPLSEAIIERLQNLVHLPVSTVIAPEIWISAAMERYFNISRDWACGADQRESASQGHDLLWEVPGAIEFPCPNCEKTSVDSFLASMLNANTPKEVVDYGMEFVWRIFPRQALFLVNGMQIEGWLVRGLPTHALLFAETSLPKKNAKLFAPIIDERNEFHGQLPKNAQEFELFEHLHLSEEDQLHVFPLRSFGTTIGLWMGLNSPASPSPEPHFDVVRWTAEKVGLAISRVALSSEIRKHD